MAWRTSSRSRGRRPTRGAVLGTVGYMAPEQVRGFEIDHRADIFACRRHPLRDVDRASAPFSGESPADTMSAILNDPPSALVFTPARRRRSRASSAGASRRTRTTDSSRRAIWRSRIESISDIRAPVPADAARVAGETSIAVLPFANISAERGQSVLQRRPGRGSDHRADAALRPARRLAHLIVPLSRTATRTSARSAATSGVGAILEGSVRRAGSRLRITAQLTNTGDGYTSGRDRSTAR